MDKRQKYNLLFALFIISIMVFSVLGYSIRGTDSNTVKYKDIKFTRNNQGFWTTRINGQLIYLFNNPKELGNISKTNIKISKLNNFKKIYLTSDSSESIDTLIAGFKINILPLITTTIRPACFVDINSCKDVPLKNCSNADQDIGIILIKKSNINKIEYTNNCLIIQGNSEELQKIIDKWTLELSLNE